MEDGVFVCLFVCVYHGLKHGVISADCSVEFGELLTKS